MKITIVIPTFNAEETISACISSLQIQTYRNFEVLIIDGASKDKTVGISQSYAAKLPALRIISEPDRGIYDAMNKAIDLAKGEWIYFLGSDDTFFENITLEKVSRFLDAENISVVYGDITSPRFTGVYGGFFSETRIFWENISHQAIFFRREVFQRIGYFDLTYRAQADWDHNMRWLLDSGILSQHIDVVIANYADGGFSSVNGDEVFQKIKLSNYLRYSRGSVSFYQRCKLYARFQKLNLRLRKYREFFHYLLAIIRL